MFEPTIIFHSSEDIWRAIQDPVTHNLPRELTFTLNSSIVRHIPVHPLVLRTDEPPNFTKISSAPTTFVYCFKCNSKNDYISAVKANIENYRKKFEKRFNSLQIVLVNDANLGKNIFQGSNIIENLVKTDYPNLVTVTIEKNGTVTVPNIQKMWQSIMFLTHNVMNTRIQILNSYISTFTFPPNNKINNNNNGNNNNNNNTDQSNNNDTNNDNNNAARMGLETIRHYLRLSAIYSSLTFYDIQERTTLKALSVIDQHPELFKDFIFESEYLEKSIDVFNYSNYHESFVMKKVPSEFGMRLAFLVRQIQSFLAIITAAATGTSMAQTGRNEEDKTIDYLWRFFKTIERRLTTLANRTNPSNENDQTGSTASNNETDNSEIGESATSEDGSNNENGLIMNSENETEETFETDKESDNDDNCYTNSLNPKILFWLTQFLHDLAHICCTTKKESDKPRVLYTAIFKKYISCLDSIISNPISISDLQDFDLLQIVKDEKRLKGEKDFIMKKTFDIFVALDLKRSALYILPNLSPENIANIDLKPILSTSLNDFGGKGSPIPRLANLFMNAPTEIKIRIAHKLLCSSFSNLETKEKLGKDNSIFLSDKSSSISNNINEIEELGAKLMNYVFGSDEKKIYYIPFSLHLPIYVKKVVKSPTRSVSRNKNKNENETGNEDKNENIIITDENDEDVFVVDEEAEIEFEVFCGFKHSSFKVNHLRVGLIDQSYKLTYFRASNVTIADRSVFKARGTFTSPGPVFPRSLVFCDDFTTLFPSVLQTIHVEGRPPPFRFTLKLPAILLPGLWQRATIDLVVGVPVLPSLEFSIMGLMHRIETLTLSSGEKIHPTTGFTFLDIPLGHHQLSIPIYATKSGAVKVEAKSSEEHQTMRKVTKFAVSEYLDVKIVYRKKTRVAQLTIFSKEGNDLTLQRVEFFDESETKMLEECVAIGLPAKVIKAKTTVLFVLQKENEDNGKLQQPESADLWLQQIGLAPFALRIKVEAKDEGELEKVERTQRIPTTPLVPIRYGL